MARRNPFVFIFLLTALFICSAYYLCFPFDLRADTEFADLDSLRTYHVQVIEPPVCKQNSLAVSVRLLDYSQQALLYLRTDSSQTTPVLGDLLMVRTRLTRPQPVFFDDFDYGNYLRLQHKVGVGYVQSAAWQYVGHMPVHTLRAYATIVRQHLIQRYRDAGLSGRALAFVSAITLGERDALDSELKHSFAAAGAAHVLAVSGLHTGIIYLVVVSLLTCFGLRRPLYEQRLLRALLSLVVILIMWGYAFITGLSPSVMRAVVMLTIVQVGWVFRRQSISVNTLAAAACICLWAEPPSLFNVSFQLSFSAVLGILLFVPYIHSVWHVTSRPARWLRELITVSVAAVIGTLPVTIYHFGQVSRYFLITNIFIIPAAYILIILGVAALLLAHTVVGAWLAVALQYISSGTCSYVAWIEQLPFATAQLAVTPLMTLCMITVILLGYICMHSKRLVWLVPAVAIVGLICVLQVQQASYNHNNQAIVLRGRTMYYRHADITERHVLTNRYTFFRYDGKDYVYAPYLSPHQQHAMEQYCHNHSIVLWQP